MRQTHIAISHPAKAARREQLKHLFAGEAKVCFLEDLTPEERELELADADVLMTWNPPRELKPREFQLLRKLRFIQLLTAGADHVPFRDVPADVVIASNVGAYSEPIAEHILGMALALAKNLFKEHLHLSQGDFSQARPNMMLSGKVCGIVGFGGIGKATARLMRCLGLRIHALNTSGRTDEAVDFIGTLHDLRTVLSHADVLVLSLPLTRETRGLIGKKELEAMKPDAMLINVARGDIVDEEALFEHLASHPDFRAGIDAWWFEPLGHGRFKTRFPFFSLPNILGSPHNSGIVPGVNEEGTRLAAENVKRFLRGEPVRGLVRREDYI